VTGYVYRAFAGMAYFFYGDYCSGYAWGLFTMARMARSTPVPLVQYSTFGVDEAGELYLAICRKRPKLAPANSLISQFWMNMR
jgi:hypothetical protein